MLRIWLYALPPLAVLLTCLVWASQTFAGDVKPLSASSTEQQSAKSDMRDAQSASTVDSIPPEAIESYLKNHSDVVVQFTSPDTNCSFCIAGFAPFNKAALTHGRLAKFVRVQWSPWQDFPAKIQELYQVKAVPAQYAFRNGRVVGRFVGRPEPVKFDAWLNKQFGATK
ncbi:MAG: thioredoxin family protein [Pseudomonadota bacterium]